MFLKHFFITILLLFSTFLFGNPLDFSYSGRLTKDSGEPVEGPVNLQVKFYRALTGGEPIPVEIPIFSGKTLVQGVFQLDFANVTDAQYHQIFSATEPTFIEVTDIISNVIYPRQKFGLVPFALKIPVDDQTIGYNSDGKLILKNTAEAGTAIVTAINSSSGATLGTGSIPNLSGDVSGSITSASVDKIRGRTISDQSPNNGDFLQWNETSSSWKPAAITGNSGGTVTQITTSTGLTGGPITGTGTLSLATSGVTAGTYTKVTVDTYGRATSGTTLGAGDLPSNIDSVKIGGGTVSDTELGYLDGVASAIQTQLDGKVVGPASAADNAIARFDGATGKLVQDSNVVIDDSGYVGIGTTAPTGRLQIQGNGYAESLITQTRYSSDGSPTTFSQYKARGTSASPAAVQVGDVLGGIGMAGFDGTTFTGNSSMKAQVDAPVSTNVLPAAFWWTSETPQGGHSYYNLYISSQGNVGVGTGTNLSKLTVKGVSSNITLLGTATKTASSTNVTGNNTVFSVEAGVGDRISIGGETKTITAISDNTSLTVDSAFTSSASGAATTLYKSIFRADDASSVTKMVISDQGNVGLGSIAPAYPLTINSSTLSGTYYRAADIMVTPTISANSNTTACAANLTSLKTVGSGITDSGMSRGVYARGYIDGSGYLEKAIGSWSVAGGSTGVTGTINYAYGLVSEIINNAGSLTINNGYGLYIYDVAATNGWGVYQTGSNDKNYFAGIIGVGTNDPQATLDINGFMKLKKNSSQPASCDANHDGAIALASNYKMCVCKNGSGWVLSWDGSTSCTW